MSPNFEPQRIATTQARHRNIDEVENVLGGMRSSHAAGDDFAVEEMLLALNKSGRNPYREEIVESVSVIAWDRFPARDEEKVGKRGRLPTSADGLPHWSQRTRFTSRQLDSNVWSATSTGREISQTSKIKGLCLLRGYPANLRN